MLGLPYARVLLSEIPELVHLHKISLYRFNGTLLPRVSPRANSTQHKVTIHIISTLLTGQHAAEQ